ncbi:MAG: hypothetical protein AB7T27_06005 [Kiritimatiellia bacterium]
MTEDAKKPLGVEDPKRVAEVQELLRLMGMFINNANLYGPQHALTAKSGDQCYNYLVPLQAKYPRINFSFSENKLLIDGGAVDLSNPFVRNMVGKLASLKIAGFSLIKGMPKMEFYKLLALIISGSSGIEDGLEHVEAERITYQQVTEQEVVVDKDAVEHADELNEKINRVQQIMAILKGEVPPDSPEAREALRETATDADQLANLIMDAAAIRQATSSVAAGESLADIVVGCLRRSFDGLMADPNANSQKGKKTIKKTMLLLEKNILDRLHALSAGNEADEQVHSEVEEMVDEVEIDALTDEYMKKRLAVEKSEERLMRYMKKKGPDELEAAGLRDKLTEAGLDQDGWKELVVKSGAEGKGGGGEGGEGEAGGTGMLTLLLTQLTELMASAEITPEKVDQQVAGIDKEVESIASGTENKIDELAQKIESERENLQHPEKHSKEELTKNHADMMELLAEIVQELCQPVAATNCAVSMLLSGHIGDISEVQRHMLDVAQRCGERLDTLLARLVEIVGLPEGLAPDKESVYGPGPGA